ncbi:MAG TPA: TolC family protein, partial [Bacteroidia bacterium]
MLLIICNIQLRAQDTLKLNYKEAEALLIKENLNILASHYDVKIAEAQTIQAKAWVNPYLHWNQDMYSVEKNEYFAYKRQALIQVDQTFSIAGKHTNTVRLAKVGLEINKLMLQDVTRSLIYELGIQFNDLSALQLKQEIYDDVLKKYEERISAGEKSLQIGSMAGNEVLRLKSELIALKTTYLESTTQLYNVMSNIREMLNLKPEVYIKAITSSEVRDTVINIADLYNGSMMYRPDYNLSLKNVLYAETNLKLQNSIAVPDINVGYQPLDRGSNYVRTYSGLVVEFSLPFFNRNTGNIMMAKSQLNKSDVLKRQKENQLLNEVNTAYMQWSSVKKCLDNYTDTFLNSIEELNQNANYNYNRK